MWTRKVTEAQLIWRTFPRQIAADLSKYHHRRIADWHRGTVDGDGELVLSSYEWLELLGAVVVTDAETKKRLIRFDFIDEEGAIAAALRDDERPEWKQMLAQVANETALLRAGQVKLKSGNVESRMWLSNAKLREMANSRQALDEAREDIYKFARRTPEQLEAGGKR